MISLSFGREPGLSALDTPLQDANTSADGHLANQTLFSHQVPTEAIVDEPLDDASDRTSASVGIKPNFVRLLWLDSQIRRQWHAF